MKIYKISLVVMIACALVGCTQLTDMLQRKSPTQTMKNFVEATQKRDVEGIKSSLSSGSLKMMEGLAKIQGKTLDQTIKEGETGGNDFKQMPEVRNEKIEGDAATLEVKDEKTGEWNTLYFVRENGEWKIALDKSLEEMLKKSFSDWKMPDFSDSNSSTDEKPSTEKKP
jgi:hypothetical protein